MIVVDASALLEGLLRVSPAGDVVEKRIFEADQTVHVPHLLDLEVTQVLRRRALHGLMTVPRCRQALDDLTNLTEKLLLLANDSALRHRLGATGQRFVIENFSVDLMVARIYELYLQLMQQSKEAQR